MLGRLFAIFLLVPIVELALLIRLGGWIGFWPTLGIIILTGAAGSLLAKRGGLSIWRRFNERLQNGELPGDELIDGMIVLVACALLITPGVLSDLTGIIGLIPFTRSYLKKYFRRRIQSSMESGGVRLTFGGFQPRDMSSAERGEAGRWSAEKQPRGDGWSDEPDSGWSGRPRDVPRHSG